MVVDISWRRPWNLGNDSRESSLGFLSAFDTPQLELKKPVIWSDSRHRQKRLQNKTTQNLTF